jgi:hypothetical protein
LNRRPGRDLLLDIVAALTVSKANLRRDPCGDWNIVGRQGHISTDGVAQYLFLRLPTKRKWENAKRALRFLNVVQDGDDEGVLKMVELPTAEQAKIIRKFLGLRKLATLADKQRATLRRFCFARNKAPVSEQIIDVLEGGRYQTQRPSPMPRDDRRRDHDQMKSSTRRRRG